MRPISVVALTAALALTFLPGDASAQRSRGYGPTDNPPQSSRGVAPRAGAAAREGIITARTPNASGNFGGPGTGGGGGSP